MATVKHWTDSVRWDAVRTRDPQAEGIFVYCVKTTKIYCRPTCKARLARRSNVEFFATGSEAETAGYRACKRCKPQLETYTPEADMSIKKVRSLLENLPGDAPLPKLEALAADAGLTKYHFHRCFKKATGLTPREYALARRRSRTSESIIRSTATRSTTTSTPSSTIDLEMGPDFIATPNELQTPDFGLGDWAMKDFEVPPSFGDYIPPLGTGNEDLNSIVPELFLHDFASKNSDPVLSSAPIHYSLVETTHGALLMAFEQGKLSRLELAPTTVQVMASLQVSFPGPFYVLTSIDVLEESQQQAMRQQVTAVVDALEQPIGNTLRPPSNATQDASATT